MKGSFPLILLTVSLAAFLVRGAIYALIGSPLPLIFILGVLAALIAARFAGAGWLAVRAWGVLLAIYGLFRLGLAALLAVAPVSSPHAIANTGWIFVLMAALYLAGGVYLVLARRWTPGGRPAG